MPLRNKMVLSDLDFHIVMLYQIDKCDQMGPTNYVPDCTSVKAKFPDCSNSFNKGKMGGRSGRLTRNIMCIFLKGFVFLILAAQLADTCSVQSIS